MGKWTSKFSNSESWTGIQRWFTSSGSAGYSGHTERTCVIPKADLCEEDSATCKLRRSGWPGIRRVAVNLPSDVESTVNDGVDVVYRGDSHAL